MCKCRLTYAAILWPAMKLGLGCSSSTWLSCGIGLVCEARPGQEENPEVPPMEDGPLHRRWSLRIGFPSSPDCQVVSVLSVKLDQDRKEIHVQLESSAYQSNRITVLCHRVWLSWHCIAGQHFRHSILVECPWGWSCHHGGATEPLPQSSLVLRMSYQSIFADTMATTAIQYCC